MIDHGVDFWVDRVEPRQRGGDRLLCRDLFRSNEGGEVDGREAPEILHGLLRVMLGLLAPLQQQGQSWPRLPFPLAGCLQNTRRRQPRRLSPPCLSRVIKRYRTRAM